MATITLRNVKGLPLTNTEIDDNFTNLNDDIQTRLYEPSGTGVIIKDGAGTSIVRTLEVSGTGLSINNADGVSGNPSITINSTSLNTPSTVVSRDASGNFAAGAITGTSLTSTGSITATGQTLAIGTVNATTVNATNLNGNVLIGAGQSLVFEGITADDYETTIAIVDPTADRTITIPNVNGTLITTGDTGTVTSTMLAGSIGNSKLTNSSVTIDGNTVSLGGSITPGFTSTSNSNVWTNFNVFRDTLFGITDNTDITKVLAFELSGLLTGTTVTLTVPADSGTIATQSHVTTQLAILVPAGVVTYFATNTAPTGWIKANGAAVNRVTYAALFSAIGTTYGSGDGINTFNLPDLRGEFIRGWDDGRGIDTSRSFASSQTQQTDSISSVESLTTSASSSITIPDDGTWSSYVITGASTGRGIRFKRNAVETRPRNIALLACIKY